MDDLIVPGDDQTLKPPWGGQISYARLGRSRGAGQVWVLFHKTPGCRLVHMVDHKYGEGKSIRIAAVDRPGYARSTLSKDRHMLDHIKDLEYLLDFLGIGQFIVCGSSGGGPYALAAAYHFPRERLCNTAIMTGSTHPEFNRASVRIQWKLEEFLDVWDSRIKPGTYPFNAKWISDIIDARVERKLVELATAKRMETARQGSAGYERDCELLN